MTPASRLTVFFGERDRVEGGWLSDRIGALLARHRTRAAVVLRGSEGFGPRHVAQSADLLSLSDDLPLQVVAFDAPGRVDALLAELRGLHAEVRTSRAEGDGAAAPGAPDLRLTVLVGRRARVDGAPAHRALVAAVRAAGASGAVALLGVEGTLDGAHARGRFLGANAAVPVAVVAVGARAAMLEAARRVARLAPAAPRLLEPVALLKADGRVTGTLPGGDGPLELSVQASEDARVGAPSLGPALIRALRADGAGGATSVRGVWGFHGGHAPHGDRLWSVHRGAPVVTTTVTGDPGAWEVVDGLTRATGLVVAQRVRTA